MVKKSILSLALVVALCCAYACDSSSDAPESTAPAAGAGAASSSSGSAASDRSTAPEAIISDKTKIPPTSKEDSTKNAVAAISEWLQQLDLGHYGACWDQTGVWFQHLSPKDQWTKQIGAIRHAFGPLMSRSVKSVEYKSSLPEMPEGVYVEVIYDSSFRDVKDAVEQITATYENNAWHPLGYSLSAKPQATATSTATPAANAKP